MSDDVTTRALLRLAEAMDTSAGELRDLAERAGVLAADAEAKSSWRDAVAAEERPLIVERLTDVINRLAEHGAAFRRAEARALSREGLSHERIAALFGVTRQRVGALLASDGADPARRRTGPTPRDADRAQPG